MKTKMQFGAVLLTLLSSACSAAPGEVTRSGDRQATRSVTQASTSIPGFQQTIDTTRFQLGEGVVNTVGSDYTRWIGSSGAFVVDNAIGSSHGVTRAGVPFAPFQGDLPTHEALVRAYFVDAGVPADQVGPVHTNVRLRGDGVSGVKTTKEVAYSSILTRFVNGVHVAESHAWARLDAGNEVVAESVYWPELDASVVSDAAALAQIIADPVAGPTLLAKLPCSADVARTGTVVIHHSSEFVHGTFELFASYDVWVPSTIGSGTTLHFDPNGQSLRLPQELRGAASSSE